MLQERQTEEVALASESAVPEWGDFARELGTRIRQLRLEKQLSQERLAYAAGITRYTYQKLEKGESTPGSPANPTLRTLMSLAQQLGVTLDELLPQPWPDLRAR